VRNDRGDRGNVGIIRSPVRVSILPDRSSSGANSSPDSAAWPSATAAQPQRMRRISVLMAQDENDPVFKARVSAFIQALSDLGWTDGRNMRMDLRWAGGDSNRIRALAQELGRPATGHDRDKHDRGDRCPPAGRAYNKKPA